MLCSPALASSADADADAKLLDYRHSTFYLYVRSCTRDAYTVRMFLTIGACARVRYSSRAWSEAEALANIARTSVFNEIHAMVTLKMPYEV